MGGKRFANEDGTDNSFVIDVSMMKELKKWDIKFKDETQRLKDDILIYDSSVYATRKSRNNNSYLIHWFDQSWQKKTGITFKVKKFIKRYLYFIFRRL